MNAPTLKFSHDYAKLPPEWEGKHVRLLCVYRVLLEEQTPAFLEYDTRLRDCPPDAVYQPHPDYDKWHYYLPTRGAFLYLLLQCLETQTIFTTLRPHTIDKAAYYYELKEGDALLTLVKV